MPANQDLNLDTKKRSSVIKTNIKKAMKQKDIIKKIKNKKATICIMGLGYVGLPLVNAFCNAGFNVNGFDTSEDKIYQIKNSKTDISEVSIKKIKKFINNED